MFLGLLATVAIQVAGMKWTSGCVRRKDIYSHEDAPVVKNYRKAGAIPVALTNVPELLLWFATSNKLYGTTNNPFDLTRVAGGSSGGEDGRFAGGDAWEVRVEEDKARAVPHVAENGERDCQRPRFAG